MSGHHLSTADLVQRELLNDFSNNRHWHSYKKACVFIS